MLDHVIRATDAVRNVLDSAVSLTASKRSICQRRRVGKTRIVQVFRSVRKMLDLIEAMQVCYDLCYGVVSYVLYSSSARRERRSTWILSPAA